MLREDVDRRRRQFLILQAANAGFTGAALRDEVRQREQIPPAPSRFHIPPDATLEEELEIRRRCIQADRRWLAAYGRQPAATSARRHGQSRARGTSRAQRPRPQGAQRRQRRLAASRDGSRQGDDDSPSDDVASLTIRFALREPTLVDVHESSDAAARALADQLDACGFTPLLTELVERIEAQA